MASRFPTRRSSPTLGTSPASPATNQQEIIQGIQSGELPAPRLDSLYLTFGNQMLTDSWAREDAGYHSWLWLNGQQVPYAEIQPNAWNIPGVAGHEPAGDHPGYPERGASRAPSRLPLSDVRQPDA